MGRAHQFAVTLVEHYPKPVCEGEPGNTQQFFALINRACRIVRGVDHNHPGTRGQGLLDRCAGEAIVIRSRVDIDGNATGQLDLGGEGFPVRHRDDDFIPRIEQHHCSVVQRLLGTRGHRYFIGGVIHPAALSDLLRQRVAKLGQADGRRIAVAGGGERIGRGGFHHRAGIEGQFARGKVDQVDAGFFQGIGFTAHAGCAGCAETLRTLGQRQ